MLAAVDYNFYRDTFGGELDEQSYNAHAARALYRLEALVGRDIPEEAQDRWRMAFCALVDHIAGASRVITSERVGDTTLTFAGGLGAMSDLDVVSPYLKGTGLVFQGLYGGGYQ